MNAHVKPIFFGYWCGDLPSVAELHFKSFLCEHPASYYDLWLDGDTLSAVHPSLYRIIQHPRINIRTFSLDTLIKATKLKTNKVSKILNILTSLWKRDDVYLRPPGITYKHSSPSFGGFHKDLAYRGDLARCLIPFFYYDGPVIYTDIDVCFLCNLLDLCGKSGFVYRWENFDFGNNAILYIPDRGLSEKIVLKGALLETYRPWVLFSNDVCAELDIKIYPAEMFDALWNKTSILYGDSSLFFKNSFNAQPIVNELLQFGYKANHWHNNWSTVPERGSPYQLLLQQIDSRLVLT
jgi:hypothetical protein